MPLAYSMINAYHHQGYNGWMQPQNVQLSYNPAHKSSLCYAGSKFHCFHNGQLGCKHHWAFLRHYVQYVSHEQKWPMESSTWRSDQQHHQHALNTPSDEDKARIISSFQSEGLLCRMCVSLALWRFEQLTIHDDPCPCLFHMWQSATFEYIIAKTKPRHFFVTWPGSLCHASFPYGRLIDAIPFPPVCWLLFTLVCTRSPEQNPRVPTMGAGGTPCTHSAITHSAITHSVSLSKTKQHHVSDVIWVVYEGGHTPSI